MPKVPTYDQFTVQPSDAALPRYTSPDMPIVTGKEAIAVGEGMIKAGTAFSAAAEKAAQEANQIRLIDATNEAVKESIFLTYDQKEGFLNFKGKAALERPDNKPLDVEYVERFQGKLEAIQNSLGNNDQKRMFKQVASQLTRQFMGNVNQHVAAEYKDYQVNTLNGSIDVATQKMTLGFGDPAVVAEQQRVITAAVAERDKNLPEDQRKANLVKALSPGNSAVVSAAVDAGNVLYAKEFLIQNAANITPENRLILAKAVEMGDFEERTQKLAEDIYKEADGDLTTALTIARERLRGKDEDRTVERLKVRAGEKDKELDKKTQDLAEKYLKEANNDFTSAIKLARENLSGAEEDRTVERLKVLQLEVKQEQDNTIEERTQKAANSIFQKANGNQTAAFELARNEHKGKDLDQIITRLKLRFEELEKESNREAAERTQKAAAKYLLEAGGDHDAAIKAAREKTTGKDQDDIVQRLKVYQQEHKNKLIENADSRAQAGAELIFQQSNGDAKLAFSLARQQYSGKDQTLVLQLLKTRFEEERQIDPTKVQTESERILTAAGGDIKKALSLARSELSGGLENDVVQKLNAMEAEKTTIRERERKAAKEAGWAAYNKYGSFDKIPKTVLAAMDPTDEAALREHANNVIYNKIARNNAAEDRAERKKYRDAAPEYLALANDPERLAQMSVNDIIALQTKMGVQHTESLLNLRNNAINNKATAKMEVTQFNEIANEFGLNSFGKNQSKNDKEVLGIVRSRVDLMLEDAAKKKRGPLSREEKAEIMRNAFKQNVEIDGFIWNDNKPAITLTPNEMDKVVVPKEDREQIIQALKEAYKKYPTKEYEPTEANIRRMYIQGLRK